MSNYQQKVLVEKVLESNPKRVVYREVIEIDTETKRILAHNLPGGVAFCNDKFEDVYTNFLKVEFTDITKKYYGETYPVVKLTCKQPVHKVQSSSIPAVIYRDEQGQVRLRCAAADKPINNLQNTYCDLHESIDKLNKNESILVRLTLSDRTLGWTDDEKTITHKDLIVGNEVDIHNGVKFIQTKVL